MRGVVRHRGGAGAPTAGGAVGSPPEGGCSAMRRRLPSSRARRDRRTRWSAGGDVQLAEDAAQVRFDRAWAQEQLCPDLPVGGRGGNESGDAQLVSGEGVGRLGGAFAGVLAGGAQLAGGPLGECLDTLSDSIWWACEGVRGRLGGDVRGAATRRRRGGCGRGTGSSWSLGAARSPLGSGPLRRAPC